MSLFTLLAVIVVAGVLLWAVTTYIPMDASLRKILVAVVVIVVVMLVLEAFGLLAPLRRLRV